jgi:hypothetical protein
MGYTPFFMVYGAEAVLPTDLDYGALRLVAYKELEAKEYLEDAMDQLDEAHDVALARSAKYSRHYADTTTDRSWAEPLVSVTWYSDASRVPWTATSYRSGQEHTSLRPSMAKSSPTLGTLNNYVLFIPR